MSEENQPEKLVGIHNAANTLRISPNRIKRWIQDGVLNHEKGKGVLLSQVKLLLEAGSPGGIGAHDEGVRSATMSENGKMGAAARWGNGDDLTELRLLSRAAIDAQNAMMLAGTLVSSEHAAEVFRLHIIEVKTRLRSIPDKWLAKAVGHGIKKADAKKLLQELSDEMLAELSRVDLVGKLESQIKDERKQVKTKL